MRHFKRDKVILTDLQYLMSVLQAEAYKKGLNIQGVWIQLQASMIFQQVKEAVYKRHTRSMHKETLKWQTWV